MCMSASMARAQAPNDSIPSLGEVLTSDSISNKLEEVEVIADSRIETGRKVILHPSKLERRHSTNAYSLLDNMNLADFIVDPSSQSISTASGRSVAILINGVDAQPDELATLSASEIVTIDYQRNPGGRYVGNGAVINFITTQYDFGGNVYLSADEGLARQYGEYIGMVNFKKNAMTLSLTASDKWQHISQLNYADNSFSLNDGFLSQQITPISNSSQSNSQYANFKFAHTSKNHSFDASLGFTRSAVPENNIKDNVTYKGLYDFNSTAARSSNELGLSPVIKQHYYLYLPTNQTLMVNSNIRYTHTKYSSNYSEIYSNDIHNNTLENSVLASVTLSYFKTLSNGLSLGTSVDEYFNHYYDSYSGDFNSKQKLENNHAMIVFHLDHSLPFGLTYFVSAGLTDLYSTIGAYTDNQFAPMAYYGLTYNINKKHTVSLTGNYLHTIYDPSMKNEAEIPTSFFEVTLGNPELGQVKAFQNYFSYNGTFGKFGLSFTYDFLKYFGNTSNHYFSQDNIMYHQLINDGDFYYHKFIFGGTANLINNKLRLKANARYAINRFKSNFRPDKRNGWRGELSASYMFGDWQVKATYAFPFNSLGLDGTTTRYPEQYGVSLNWKRGNWAAELNVENLFKRRYATSAEGDYGAYRFYSRSFSNLKGRNISLSLTYAFSYGKKTDREEVRTETTVNSAILRPF